MPSRKSIVAALVSFALLSASARAEEPDPVLRGLIDEALAKNPQIVAAGHLVSAAATLGDQASARPGPMVGLSYQNDGLAPSLGQRDMTMLSAQASQEFPYPGKRTLRRQVAEAGATQTAFDAERVRLSVIGSVKRAYYGLRLARALAALAEQQRNAWKEIQEAARARYASAVSGQQELLRAQVEATRVQALHAQHHAEAAARLAELNLLLARPPDTPVETATEPVLAPEPRSIENLIAFSESISPELRMATAGVQRDEFAVSLARREFKPDLVVQGGWSYRGGLDPMWQAGVSLALPSRARVRAALAEAEARLAASRALIEDVRLRLRSAVEQRVVLLRAAEQIESTYREGVVPQEQVAVESALARYRTGQGPQLSVLEAMVSLLDDRTDYLRVVTAHAVERTRLEEASLEPASGFEGLLMHGRTTGAGAMGMQSEPATRRPGAPVAASQEMR